MMRALTLWLALILTVVIWLWVWNSIASACEEPRPADCRVYEDTHTCIERLDERRREIGDAVARALNNLE